MENRLGEDEVVDQNGAQGDGKQTGKMAAQVLKGEKKASELNFETITTPGFYVNNKVAENLGITVPTDLSDNAVETFDEITQSK